MKKLFSVAIALLMGISLVACGPAAETQTPVAEATPAVEAPVDEAPEADAPEAEVPEETTDAPVTLVWAEVNPADSLMGQTATAFKDKVEELTDGSVTIDIQFSAVLGDEATVLDTMIGGGGSIDMTRIATFSLNNFGAQRQSLLSIPFTFQNRQHFWNVANSDLGAELLNEPAELGLGVQGLFFVEEGFRHFFVNREISGMADLAGMKLRVSDDPIMNGMVNGLGASPTVVAFGELYTSLSSGVVDGAEQPIANYQSNAFNEVASTMILDGHTLGCGEVIILESSLAKLSDSQRAAVEEASQFASDFNANLSEENENKCIEELTAAGVNFVEVENKQEWADACADIIAQFSAGMEDTYAEILGMQ
jgi:tripartite ATP-independent transporter DctP family solute receptor